MDVRKIIQTRLNALGNSKYWLAVEVADKKVRAGTIYDFLRGTSDITSSKLGHILDALDLRIVGADEMAEQFERGWNARDTNPDTRTKKSAVGKRKPTRRGASRRSK